MDDQDMQEKRKFVRLDAAVEIKWEKTSDIVEDNLTKKDTARNISAGGICLSSYEEIKVGDMLKLQLELPSKSIIYAVGIVRWIKSFEIVGKQDSKHYDAGIEFLDISEEDREQVGKFVFMFLPEKKEQGKET